MLQIVVNVSQFKVRMCEQLLHEHDQVHQTHRTEIITNGEIILSIQHQIGIVVIYNLIMHGDEEVIIMD